ncbi:hypothetical protein AVEN_55701-1, partial [Araneus ventricosus]
IHKLIYLIWLSSHVIALSALSEQIAVQKHAEKAIELFKIKFHRTLDEASIRRRRSFMNDENKYYETPTITSRNIYSSSLPVVAWCVLHLDRGEIPFAATEEEIGIFDKELLPLVNISNGERIYLLLGFQYEDDLWLVTIQYDEDEHSFGIYKYSDDDNLVLDDFFALPGESLAMIAEVQHTVYLPILSNVHSDSILNLFIWEQIQFDPIVELPLKGNGKSLASWEMHGILFVAVSFDDFLKIFHFSEKHKRLILTQQVEQNCNIVKHFKVAKIHYLVCSGRNKILLYWWNGDRFSELQEICDVDPAVDIALMNLSDDNIVIVSVKHNRLDFYFQNSGSYIKLKEVEILEDGELRSANVWKKMDAFYLLPVFQDDNDISVIHLDVSFPKSPLLQDVNAYHSCALDLEKVLNNVDDKIKNSYLKHSNIWTKNKSFRISEVHVKGAVISNQTTKISQISFVDSDSLNAQSISSLINKLSTKLRKLQYILRNAVLKSTYQEIYGNLKFDNSIIASNTTISRLTDHLDINGVHISALTSALKKAGTQTISPGLTFNGGIVKSIKTSFLNSKGLTDYLLLSKHWEYVKGHLQFKDLSVNNMKVKSYMLNDIALRDIMTTTAPQNITCRKTFRHLSSAFITTNGNISGVNMSNLKRIILKDTTEFGMMLHLTSDITFKNMNVHSINGKDLSNLVLNSVKYLEDQSIQGIKVFTESLNIESNLSTVGYINNVNLSHLMTLHTPQTHYNDFEIIDVSFEEINTHSVNGIELWEEAIRKSGDFKVNDKVSFTQSLVIDDIILKNGVLLNNMDISNEVPFGISTEKHVFNDSVEISNITVMNNVEITDDRIQFLLSNLMNNVWLKTKAQYVPYAHFKLMNAIDLNVKSLNDVSFNEIVLSNQSAVISSDKEFLDIEVQSILLQDGKTLNNVDFTSKSLISSFFEKLKSFIVKDMLVEGNLDVSTFNYVNISDLMQVEKFQECDGPKSFNFISVNELIASALDFESIHDKVFSEYVADSMPLQSLGYIFNKKFNFISSEELNIAGFLNGGKFEDLSKSVATLNSDQIISSDIKFISGIKMGSANIKNLNIPNLDNIVCKDRIEKNILHKQFQRIYANKADFGTANGVDVSTLQNAFLKGEDNWISKEMKFKSDLMVSKIRILSPASIDGVKLDDIFKINDANNLASMNLANFRAKNVDVFGKINGCDLSDVREFLMKRLSVKSEKFFTNLVVDGNLYVKNVLNGLPESSFLDIASSLPSAFNMKRSFNFLNVKATQLKVLDVVNGINIDFLLKDAVMPHMPQTILGKKSFSKITTSNITVNMLNVIFLNKFNFPLIYQKYLSKESNQMIALNLPNITAGEVFIKGSLNRVKVPEDVVLVHSDERITSDVICQEPITSFSMHVGEINNTDLLQFLRNVVSLKSNENISSALTFVKGFFSKGDLRIINSLHGIDLNDVVKTSNEFLQNSINGNKTFLEELKLMSDFSISGFVNYIDLENLSENLCQRSKFEFFEDMVYFAGLKASSLYVANINKVSVESLWAHIHNVEETIHDRLDNATDVINEIKYRLLNIKDGNNGSSSFFAYFELHQILNLGSSLRFLPMLEAGVFGEVYQLPTKEVIVWINQNETCTSFKSLKLTVQLDGTLKETGRIHGRTFPFSLRVIEEDVQGFRLHVDRAIRCTSESRAADILKTVFTSGNDSVHVMHSPSSSNVLDAKLLETEDGIFIVIAYEIMGNGERMHVYKYDGINDTWMHCQKFHSSNVSSFDMIYIDDDSENPEGYLVVTGKDATSGIYLYLWDFEIKEFIFKSSISKLVSTSALWSSTDQDVFLLLAKEKTKVFKNNVWSFIYSDPVEVYVLKDDLKFCYEINIYGISSFDTFKLAGETYVLAVSPHLQTVYLLQYRGYSGFQVIQEFNAPGVVSVSVFSSGSDIFLAIASKTGHTRILKCVMRGGNFVGRKELMF